MVPHWEREWEQGARGLSCQSPPGQVPSCLVSQGEKPVHSRAGVLRTRPLEVAKGGKNPGLKVTAPEAKPEQRECPSCVARMQTGWEGSGWKGRPVREAAVLSRALWCLAGAGWTGLKVDVDKDNCPHL